MLSNSYANRVIFYMNACFAVIVGAGVMAQFVSGKDSVTCRTDGTRRIAEPGSGLPLSMYSVSLLVRKKPIHLPSRQIHCFLSLLPAKCIMVLEP